MASGARADRLILSRPQPMKSSRETGGLMFADRRGPSSRCINNAADQILYSHCLPATHDAELNLQWRRTCGGIR